MSWRWRLVAAFAVAGLSLGLAGAWASGRGSVSRVVDGDTLDVDMVLGGRVRVRLYGVDCVESSRNAKCVREECDPAEGRRAADRVRQLAGGRDVVLEGRGRRDRWGRELGYVRLPDGGDLGLVLVREGVCPADGRYPHPRRAEYR